MENKTDVIVIGAGSIGISTAYYLWKNGLNVTVIEKDEVCSGCSKANAGLIVPSQFIPLAAPGVIAQGLKWMFNPKSPFYVKPRFNLGLLSWGWKFYRACTEKHLKRSMPVLRDACLASLALFDELSEIEGVDFGLEKNGLFIFHNSEKCAEDHREYKRLADEIEFEAELFNNEQINEMDPNIRTSAKGAIYFPQDAHLDPYIFVSSLSNYLKQNGVKILTSTEVLGLEKSNDKITRIKTSKGDFTADEVVLAAGSWSSTIERDLQPRLPIQAGKGYSVDAKIQGSVPRIPFICEEIHVVVTPLGDTLRFAGTLELAGLDLSINHRRVSHMFESLSDYLPDFNKDIIDQTKVWSGLRPCAPDGFPFLGRFKSHKNLIAATGHGMLGITLAPITGKLVSEIVENKTPSIDLTLFDVKRYS